MIRAEAIGIEATKRLTIPAIKRWGLFIVAKLRVFHF
jgi:hypothetical protein